MIMKCVVTIDTYKHTNDFTLCLNQCDVGPIDIIFNIFKIKIWYTNRKKDVAMFSNLGGLLSSNALGIIWPPGCNRVN